MFFNNYTEFDVITLCQCGRFLYDYSWWQKYFNRLLCLIIEYDAKIFFRRFLSYLSSKRIVVYNFSKTITINEKNAHLQFFQAPNFLFCSIKIIYKLFKCIFTDIWNMILIYFYSNLLLRKSHLISKSKFKVHYIFPHKTFKRVLNSARKK